MNTPVESLLPQCPHPSSNRVDWSGVNTIRVAVPTVPVPTCPVHERSGDRLSSHVAVRLPDGDAPVTANGWPGGTTDGS
jgi:hypothetical protein